MPVDSTSTYVDALSEGWTMIDDLQSEKLMKDAGTDYVAQLTGQSDDEYRAYIRRGSLFGAFVRTVRGLTGAIMRKPPQVNAPVKVEELFGDLTLDGKDFNEVVRKVVTENVKKGYYGILVDSPPEGGTPKLAMYAANAILQPTVKRIGNEIKLIGLTLQENIDVPREDDPYETEEIEQVRELKIDEDGFYEQILHVNDGSGWVAGEPIYPTIMGKRLTEIPFVFFGASENSTAPKEGPLLDLGYLNVKHFIITVDYFHALHFCGLPTPFAAGFKLKDGESLHIGSATAWVSEDPQAKCGMLQLGADGIGAIEAALDKLEKQMSVVGSRMLDQARAGVETAEGLLIKQTSDFAILSSIASCTEAGMHDVLVWLARWVGASESEISKIKVMLNKDFSTSEIDPQVLTALFVALQSGTISVDSFLYFLKQKEVLPNHRTIEEEKSLILSGENTELVEKMFGSVVAEDVTDNRLKSASSVNTNGQET